MSEVIAIAADGEFTCWDAIGGDIIAFGMVEILSDYTLGRELLIYSRPRSEKYYSAEAQEVHKISFWKAQTFPEPREGCIKILHWLAPHLDKFPLDFVYHGLGGLDWRWLTAHFRKEDLEPSILKAFEQKPESTILMARKALKHIPESKVINPHTGKYYTKFSLRNVSDFYEIEFDHHDALSDARASAQIYCNIKKGVNTWTGELL